MKYFRILAALLLLPVVAFAQPQSHLSGQVVSIDATRAVNICSGTEDIRLATGCTGGGTQYTWVFDASTGTLDAGEDLKLAASDDITIDAGDDISLQFFVRTWTLDAGLNSLEPNTNAHLGFTQPFSSINGTGFLAADGSAATPAYRFTSDTDTGIFREGTDLLSLAAGGVRGLQISESGSVAQALVNVGSAASPGLGFNGDSDTGFYREAAGQITVSSNASKRWAFQTDGDFELATTAAGLVLRSPDGTYSKCTVDNADAWSCAGV